MSMVAVPSTTHSSSDEEFVRSFRELYSEHYQLVYRTAYSVTGSRQDAEDVLQTVFMNLLERENVREVIKSPTAYLYRAAVNNALNTVRSRRRRDPMDIEDLDSHRSAVSTNNDEPMQQRRLLNAIARLKPRAVELLVLRYELGYNDAEIAKMLGKSRGTIAVALYRIRARLKKLLRKSGDNR